MKTKIIPFDLETAKRIQSGEIEGRIVTRSGYNVKILCFDFKHPFHPIVGIIVLPEEKQDVIYNFTKDGRNGFNTVIDEHPTDLFIELPEEEPQTFHTEFPKGQAVLHGNTIICVKEETSKNKFKPFDKVLVRENDGQVWHCDFYSYTDRIHGAHYCVGHCGEQILPYEGNEHLVGTTDKPKEE